MKQNLFNKLWLRVGMIVAIMTTALSGTAWAQDVSLFYTLDGTQTGGTNNYATESEITQNDITWMVTGNTTLNPWRIGGKSLTSVDRPVYSTTAMGSAISKVDLTVGAASSITVNSLKLVVASDDAFTSIIDEVTATFVANSTITFTPTSGTQWATGACYKFVFNVTVSGTSNKFVEFKSAKFYAPASSPVVSAPTFSPEAGTYTSAQNVEISTATTGATIYYTTDGTTPTTSSSVYSSAIAVSETTTIKAIAAKSGMTNSDMSEATYNIVTIEHAGTEADPYTVADARNAIDAGIGVTGVYATGIVSKIVTAYSSEYGNISYNISVDGTETADQLQAYRGKSYDGANFTSENDIKVGDVVVVYGNLKKHNSTYEFDANNELVSLVRPGADPVINADNVTIAYDVTSGSISYTIDNEVTGTSLTATTEATWLTLGTVGEGSVPFTCSENDGDEDRTATVTLTYGDVTKDVTVTQGHYVAPVADYATLPFSWAGGASADLLALAGVTANGLGSDYASGNAPYLAKFDGTGDYIQVKTDSRPGVVTIGVKMIGGSTTSTITVQESADGETFSDVQALTISGAQNDVLTLSTSTEFAETSRYVRLYFTKGSNVGVGPISIAAYAPIVLSDYTLTIENPANVTITANYGEEVLTNGEEAKVTQGTEVTLAITPASGYDFESLTIEGAEEGQIVTPTETSSEGVYTFNMPAYDITVSATVVEHVEPATASYVLATSITSGKRYVIASGTEDGTVQVMGDQANNNRPAVEATITNGVLSVSDEYEFVIESATVGEATGYSIYDENVPGYLYAAASGSNHLKTQAENNVNGIWTITFGEGGVASVVAEGSSNRNVMQYNSNNTLFSCYASASQAPVYLYEKVEPETESVTVGASGYATFASDNDLNFEGSGIKAFYATAEESTLTFHQIDVVPAGTGVLLYSATGAVTADIPVYTGTATGVTNNVFVRGTGDAVTYDADNDHFYYVLAKVNNVVGFYQANNNTVATNRAYISVGGSLVKSFGINLDDDATAISTVESFTEEGAIYNVAGQRLQKMQKGINIVNGKKVLK